MNRISSTAAACLTLLAATSIAHADVINFTGLPNGTAVTNEYAGVTFSLMGLPDSDGPPTIDTFYDGTGLANSTNPDYPTANVLNIAFAAPVSDVSFTFSNYGASAPTTYTAYNASDGVVDSGDLQFVDPPSSFQLVPVSGSGITDLQINDNFGDSSWYFAIQELAFTPSTTAVPEPSLLILFGSALLGLAMVGRHKRNAA